jgi:hypothetical protein
MLLHRPNEKHGIGRHPSSVERSDAELSAALCARKAGTHFIRAWNRSRGSCLVIQFFLLEGCKYNIFALSLVHILSYVDKNTIEMEVKLFIALLV